MSALTRREATVQVYRSYGGFVPHDGWAYDEAPGLAIADGAPAVRWDGASPPAYSLTHIPTGRTLGSFRNLEDAEQALEVIHDLADWPSLTYPVPKDVAKKLGPILDRHQWHSWMVLNP